MENNDTNYDEKSIYSETLIKLLKGILYNDDVNAWDNLRIFQKDIRNYFLKINLELIIDEDKGFAFLKQIENDENKNNLPKLINKTSLGYDLTCFLVILREWLEDFKKNSANLSTLYISEEDIKERIEYFFKHNTDGLQLIKRIKHLIKETIKLGFIKEINNSIELKYEVKRSLEAKVNVDFLENFKEELEKNGTEN